MPAVTVETLRELGGAIPTWAAAEVLHVSRQRVDKLAAEHRLQELRFPSGGKLILCASVVRYDEERRARLGKGGPEIQRSLCEVLGQEK